MAEVEIHTGHEHGGDSYAQRVSVMVGVVGILLAIVTIASHRAHTAAVIHRTEANDQWSFYEAKKLREHLMEVSSALLTIVAVRDTDKAQQLAEQYHKEHDRYLKDSKDIEAEANARQNESDREEKRALRLDLGEGLLELGLVLSSLYFLSRQRFFPLLGGVAALAGTLVAASNWLV